MNKKADSEDKWVKIPSLDTILKMLGMLATVGYFIYAMGGWVEKVDAYMASNEVWKGYEIAWFNRICKEIHKGPCADMPENK